MTSEWPTVARAGGPERDHVRRRLSARRRRRRRRLASTNHNTSGRHSRLRFGYSGATSLEDVAKTYVTVHVVADDPSVPGVSSLKPNLPRNQDASRLVDKGERESSLSSRNVPTPTGAFPLHLLRAFSLLPLSIFPFHHQEKKNKGVGLDTRARKITVSPRSQSAPLT